MPFDIKIFIDTTKITINIILLFLLHLLTLYSITLTHSKMGG